MAVSRRGEVWQVSFRYTDRYGRRKRYRKSGFTRQKDANNHETKMKAELLESGIIYERQKRTINDVWDEFSKFDHTLAVSTREVYKMFFDRFVRDDIGKSYIDTVDFKLMQDFFADLGRNNPKSSCDWVYRVFNKLFKYAYNLEYIQRLPYTSMVIKGQTKAKKRHEQTITHEQYLIICDFIEKSRRINTPRRRSALIAVKLGYYTGMRIGEILALDKADLDFDRMQINVDKSLAFLPVTKELIIKPPKSASSKAKIPLPEEIKDELLEWVELCPTDHLLCTNNLEYIRPTSLMNFFSHMSKHTGFPFNFHMLRHTYATTLWKNNVDIKYAQRLLRHENYSTTMDIYTEIENENLNEITSNLKR